MGALFMFDEEVTASDKKGKRSKCQVEVLDNHGIPEIRIGPLGEAHSGTIAEFGDWAQFERFVQSLNDLKQRLKEVQV